MEERKKETGREGVRKQMREGGSEGRRCIVREGGTESGREGRIKVVRYQCEFVHSFSTVDAFEPKTMVTRKLRRRPHDPLPAVEKRRKLTPLSSLVYVLDEGEVDEDLKVIFKVRGNISVIVQ